MQNARTNRHRWFRSGMIGAGFLLTSGAVALAQAVPGEDATQPAGAPNAAATQIIQLKPGQTATTARALPANTGANPDASVQDAHFALRASAINHAEILLGRLAERRGQTAAEQAYGRRLAEDHTHAEAALMRIIDTNHLSAARQPGPMMHAAFQRLEQTPDSHFDASFNTMAMKIHQRVIHLYEMEAHNGQNPVLRAYAVQVLPVLHVHLHMAEALMPDGAAMADGMVPTSPAMGHHGIHAQAHAVRSQPITGNPDHSADQLNARVLSVMGQPS